jgi:squalene synthase HpnC
MKGTGHYENFPVASVLLPTRLRPAVLAIYAFARSADDFADEGDLSDAERLARLDDYLDQLDRLEAGLPALSALFASLETVIRQYALPVDLFRDLISAFSQDVRIKRYGQYGELIAYCKRSANPVGRLMLHLYGAATAENLHRSDCICTSLQLINFLQDIAVDLGKNRIYLPLDEMQQFGVEEGRLLSRDATGPWWPLIEFQLERTQKMLLEGAPLARVLPGRIGLEIRMIVMGGDRILKKIRDSRGDVFSHRPVLTKWDWSAMLLRALFAYP